MRKKKEEYIVPIDPEDPPVPEVICKTCKFYGHKTYRCHRYPKKSSDFYPITPHDWCGEHIFA